MLKKRLIGVITIRHGWSVQSFGYNRYLPLGKPEVLIENLDRWGADEILVQCVDRSKYDLGPDFELLRRIGTLGLSTPLIYAGGIRHATDAVFAVSLGADRVSVDAMLWDSPHMLEILSRELGTQAIIANMPVRQHNHMLYWLNYRFGHERILDASLLSVLPLEWVSEVMLTDWSHEGMAGGYDYQIPLCFPLTDKPLLLFGGLTETTQFQRLLSLTNVVGAGVGNFLCYKEHAIQQIKQNVVGVPMRAAHYAEDKYIL